MKHEPRAGVETRHVCGLRVWVEWSVAHTSTPVNNRPSFCGLSTTVHTCLHVIRQHLLITAWHKFQATMAQAADQTATMTPNNRSSPREQHRPSSPHATPKTIWIHFSFLGSRPPFVTPLGMSCLVPSRQRRTSARNEMRWDERCTRCIAATSTLPLHCATANLLLRFFVGAWALRPWSEEPGQNAPLAYARGTALATGQLVCEYRREK